LGKYEHEPTDKLQGQMMFFVICSHMRVRDKMEQQIKSIKLAKDLKQAGTSFVGAINRSPGEGGGGGNPL